MSVSLSPSSTLGFPRPLTQLVKRSLSLTNHNDHPVAFKVKTTAPKLYCVRPNSGRVEPGETVEVSVMLQAMKEEPPLNTKCKDKFLIQSTLITKDKEEKSLQDIWNVPEDAADENKVHQQKLKVQYLRAEGQTLEEEDEPLPNQSSMMNSTNNDSQFDTVRQAPFTNGQVYPAPAPIPEFNRPPVEERSASPPAEIAPTQEHFEEPKAVEPSPPAPAPAPAPVPARAPAPAPITVPVHTPAPAPAPTTPPAQAPAPVPAVVRASEPAPVQAPEPEAIEVPITIVEPPAESTVFAEHERSLSPSPPSDELLIKYREAEAEIERLRGLLAAAAPPSEIRRRSRRYSDADTIAPGSEVGTYVDEGPMQPEGVPLQVVVIIAMGVFITTYLFF